jgi:2-keto-4-pentenoate hydratase/2-oxohepta-3-ene-1,7-dioic acid hydratase in catechol pathway
MKLATFSSGNLQKRVGLVTNDGVIDIERHLVDSVPDMISLIQHWAIFQPKIERIRNNKPDFVLADVHLHAPVQEPSKILAIGMNYKSHLDEIGLDVPPMQVWFAKLKSALNGPFDPIDLPVVSECLDFEAEMVFIVGKRCRNVPFERAREVIFGYCVGNDVSVRDWQGQPRPYPQFVLGKSFDTHAPFGPWITTADQVTPHNLRMRTTVNGVVRQDANTSEMLFDCYRQIEHLTKAMTLEPGDVIYTGTPAGVGNAEKPKRFLVEGDEVQVDIESLGSIKASVRKGPSNVLIE